LLLLDSIEKSAKAAAQRLHERLRRHPRRVAAAVCTLLGGFAVTAFGIAPLAPDAADLPQRLITQELPLSNWKTWPSTRWSCLAPI
jgi:hypothetical protein